MSSAARFEASVSVYEGGRKVPQYTVDSDLDGELTLMDLLEWTKAALIVTADEILKEEQALGFDKEPILAVDGRVGKSVHLVQPLGQIEFTARVSSSVDIVLEAYEGILYRSKVLTGLYKSSHFVFLNGQQIATNMQELKLWETTKPELKEKDIFRIVNIQPYARKLERFGITAQRSKTRYENNKSRRNDASRTTFVQSPNGTYFLTTRAIKSKYKRNADIRFSFLSGSSLGLSASFKTGGRTRKKSGVGRPYLYPTMTISVQERGQL